ncbi:MAG: hypothetical protein GY749_40285 [Desulfobacteraceae bacterium]|nr:hypothetical protein [Desulfobacteraceae bacterium]
MPKIQYINKKFSKASREIIDRANGILEEYTAQGYDLTLRQLYYQFVARDILKNDQKEYSRLGSIINKARLAGETDWDHITDRTRNLEGSSHWDSPADIIETAKHSFRTDKWENQEYYIECWVEKDALVGVLERICREIDINWFSCRGYTSQSEMWAAARRLMGKHGKKTVVLHMGDHDPSGIDMTRDIRDRLALFGSSVQVERIALNMNQIEKYRPPPNPAKLTDSRCGKYIKEYGSKSWELDALEPSVLSRLVAAHAAIYRDDDLYDIAAADEARGIEFLDRVVEQWPEVEAFLSES